MSLRKTGGMETADTDSDPYGSKNNRRLAVNLRRLIGRFLP